MFLVAPWDPLYILGNSGWVQYVVQLSGTLLGGAFHMSSKSIFSVEAGDRCWMISGSLLPPNGFLKSERLKWSIKEAFEYFLSAPIIAFHHFSTLSSHKTISSRTISATQKLFVTIFPVIPYCSNLNPHSKLLKRYWKDDSYWPFDNIFYTAHQSLFYSCSHWNLDLNFIWLYIGLDLHFPLYPQLLLSTRQCPWAGHWIPITPDG